MCLKTLIPQISCHCHSAQGQAHTYSYGCLENKTNPYNTITIIFPKSLLSSIATTINFMNSLLGQRPHPADPPPPFPYTHMHTLLLMVKSKFLPLFPHVWRVAGNSSQSFHRANFAFCSASQPSFECRFFGKVGKLKVACGNHVQLCCPQVSNSTHRCSRKGPILGVI